MSFFARPGEKRHTKMESTMLPQAKNAFQFQFLRLKSDIQALTQAT